MSDFHVDGGHGGVDGGAFANGQKEKDWTLEASLYQEKRLKELGVDVSMTRKTDVNYESVERTNIVKRSGAKVCISNHFNAGGGEGCETIHSIHSKDTFAKLIAKELVAAGQPLRRVFTRKYGTGDYYYMHRMTGNVETVIVEYGFLDNAKDFARLNKKDYRIKLYEAVVKAVCEYIGVKYVAPETIVKVAAVVKPKPKPKPTVKPTPNTSGKLYRVQVGAFGVKENADKVAEALKKAGFPSVVTFE